MWKSAGKMEAPIGFGYFRNHVIYKALIKNADIYGVHLNGFDIMRYKLHNFVHCTNIIINWIFDYPIIKMYVYIIIIREYWTIIAAIIVKYRSSLVINKKYFEL